MCTCSDIRARDQLNGRAVAVKLPFLKKKKKKKKMEIKKIEFKRSEHKLIQNITKYKTNKQNCTFKIIIIKIIIFNNVTIIIVVII